MMKLNKVPLELDTLIEKINQYCVINDFVLNHEKKSDHSVLKIFNQDFPGVIRVYQTKRGLTIDGSLGNNSDLNAKVLDFVKEVVAGKESTEIRVTFKKIDVDKYNEILDRIKEYFVSISTVSIIMVDEISTKGYVDTLIVNESSKERSTVRRYPNGTIYLFGYNFHLGNEILNIFSSVLNSDLTTKVDFLDDVVHYCNEKYILDNGVECKNCENSCGGDCSKLLQDIHYGSTQRYSCNKVINYYLPKYSYRYAYEMEAILEKSNHHIAELENLKILSIGCGPATELIGALNFITKNKMKLSYIGVDLNEKWADIHNKLNKYTNEHIKLKFYYKDIFELIDTMNKDKKELNSNVVIFQYVISDITKHFSRDEIELFVEKFKREIIEFMPKNSLILFNDINHKIKVRDIYEMFASGLDTNKYEFYRYYFNPKYDDYSKYGTEILDSRIKYKIPEYIEKRYNPWNTCRSAVMVIRKVEKSDY